MFQCHVKLTLASALKQLIQHADYCESVSDFAVGVGKCNLRLAAHNPINFCPCLFCSTVSFFLFRKLHSDARSITVTSEAFLKSKDSSAMWPTIQTGQRFCGAAI